MAAKLFGVRFGGLRVSILDFLFDTHITFFGEFQADAVVATSEGGAQ